MNNMKENALFLCGYPKSGTTLLLALLDNHPELNVFPEELKTFTGVLPQNTLNDKRQFILEKSGAYIPKLGKVDFPSGKRDYSSIDGMQYINSLKDKLYNSQTDKDLFISIFDNWKLFAANNKNKDNFKFLVEKTPHNELYIDIIKRWFNKPKFIYIIRDPRDNYLSYKKKQPHLNLKKYVFHWKKSVKMINNLTDEEALVIKYEDLTNDIDLIIRKICTFLNISYTDSLKIPTRNGIVWEGNSMFGDNKGNVHKNAVERYKEKMDKNFIKEIEEYLFDELNQFDYNINYATSKQELFFINKMIFETKFLLKHKYYRTKELK